MSGVTGSRPLVETLKLKARDWRVIRSGCCRNNSIMLSWRARGTHVMTIVTPHREARPRREIILLMYQGFK